MQICDFFKLQIIFLSTWNDNTKITRKNVLEDVATKLWVKLLKLSKIIFSLSILLSDYCSQLPSIFDRNGEKSLDILLNGLGTIKV